MLHLDATNPETTTEELWDQTHHLLITDEGNAGLFSEIWAAVKTLLSHEQTHSNSVSEGDLAQGQTFGEENIIDSTQTSRQGRQWITIQTPRLYLPEHSRWMCVSTDTHPSHNPQPHLLVELQLPGTARRGLQLLQDSPIWMLQYT